MASDSIHTVFISSTFDDLREERAEVQKAVLRLGCLPIGMELFPSADEDAWGFIKGEIERCDYYVLIIGGRYGSVDKDGISFTEKEYRFAKELNKPRLVFVRSTGYPVSQDKLEHDDAKRNQLQRFIAELNEHRMALRFETLHQLGGDAYYSLTELRKKRPAPGYIRLSPGMEDAEQAIRALLEANAHLSVELDQMRSTNQQLEADLASCWQRLNAMSKAPPTVLLLDDNRDLLDLMARLMAKTGWRILTAESVRGAKQVLSSHHIDAALLDTCYRMVTGWIWL